MTANETLLRRVAVTHALLLVVFASSLGFLGRPLDGLLLGGALSGFSFLTFWALARTLLGPGRKGLAYALGAMKILLYFGLTAAVLSGRLAADPLGFSVGVTCFVVAVISVALAGSSPRALGDSYGSIGS